MKRRLGTAAMGLIVAVIAVALAAPIATPVAAQNRATRPQIDRPDGPVWSVIRKNCTRCHGIDDYAYYALDRAGWQSLIESKHKTGPGAGAADVLSETDRGILLDWLVSKLGPDTKPFPRGYVAPEITEFLSDPEAYRLMNRACVSCHSIDRINETRNSADRWRVVAVQMRERGAKITDDELEGLVEWLARVKGINPNQ
jgi:mono/diheme cytochrome c family protein